MSVENNLLGVFKAMFSTNWKFVTDEQKSEFFFIFNRYFSKVYPEKAQILNDKSIDKAMAMNIWHAFMKTQPYPNWFWSKSDKKEKQVISEKDFKSLLRFLEIKPFDLNYLIDKDFDYIKEELDYIKKLDKL